MQDPADHRTPPAREESAPGTERGGDAISWRPGTPLAHLQARAALLARIRAFFAARGVLEVETPVLAAATATDPHLHSLSARYTGPGAAAGRTLYLQTSPEFAMKRLLAAGSGPIYQLARVFRDAEAGRLHNPEFTLLEWYRPGFDHHALMDEVEALLAAVLGFSAGGERVSYAQAFERRLGIDPHGADLQALRACARAAGLESPPALDTRDGWLDLLMSHCVAPALGGGRPVFVYDYPASQAALARIRPGRPPLAERFEVFLDGMELANGFHELTDAAEQRARFERDRAARRAAGLTDTPIDERLLAALSHGLPACAGVALGVDRLLMARLGAGAIDEVIAFSVERA